jgi:ubiquinone/menaquinone biosynthesis C-methylase UbiE
VKLSLDITQSMRQDWDARARKNAFHYIAAWRTEWDRESFLSSGEEDFERLVAPILSRCRLPVAGNAMLELGCGIGRMTHCFAKRFNRVYAFDISPEMLRQARMIHQDRNNVLWLLSNGADLSCVDSSSMDFVFSYLVLQHLPKESLTLRYVQELIRVLRPGGVFLFQFNSGFDATMNWRGQAAWGIIDSLWSFRLRRASHALAKAFGFDPCAAGSSWRGAPIAAERIEETVRAAGGELRETTGRNTPLTWCCGVRSAVNG